MSNGFEVVARGTQGFPKGPGASQEPPKDSEGLQAPGNTRESQRLPSAAQGFQRASIGCPRLPNNPKKLRGAPGSKKFLEAPRSCHMAPGCPQKLPETRVPLFMNSALRGAGSPRHTWTEGWQVPRRNRFVCLAKALHKVGLSPSTESSNCGGLDVDSRTLFQKLNMHRKLSIEHWANQID
jgi:hypothetical protein